MGEMSRKDYHRAEALLTIAGAELITKATGTITCLGVTAGKTVTVNGLVYTAVAGAKADDTEFSIDTSDNACALDLADSIDGDVRAGTTLDTGATAATNVVTVEETVGGLAGNAITLASDDAVLLNVSGEILTGGKDSPIVTINGLAYTGVNGAKADNTEFSLDTDDVAIATDLATSINADVRVGVTVATVDVSALAAANRILLVGTPMQYAQAVGIVVVGNITTSSAFLQVAGLIASGNETMRQVTYMNSPYSVQATGLDKHPEKYILMTSANIDALIKGTIVNVGNQDGYIKTVTGSNPVTSIVISIPNEGETGIIDTTYTKAQLLASRNIFFQSK